MKSREERKARFAEKEVIRKEKVAANNARFKERMAGIKAKSAEDNAKIKADWDEAKESRALEVAEAGPALYTPSLLGEVAAAVIPGVAIYQSAKSDKAAKAVRDAMTPEQLAAARRFPMGQGGA